AWVSGRAGCEHNARLLREHVLAASDRTGLPVNLIGYSKGCADSLTMLGSYADASAAVTSLVSYAGVVHGTPLAEGIPAWMNNALRYLPLPGEAIGDGRAIADLTRQARRRFFANHELAEDIRFASIIALPEAARVSRVLISAYQKLSHIDVNNDSQVIDHDAVLPAGEVLAIVNADHWAIALPIAERFPRIAGFFVNHNQFPRDVLLQTIIDHLADTPVERN
ncbi:MAG: hypothetical protein HKN42_12250, partial [Granulosicoccus sp.]|nr:hypothetical protein [Granulosicoccus sp.]